MELPTQEAGGIRGQVGNPQQALRLVTHVCPGGRFGGGGGGPAKELNYFLLMICHCFKITKYSKNFS